jgi:hypothetical protein
VASSSAQPASTSADEAAVAPATLKNVRRRTGRAENKREKEVKLMVMNAREST